MSFDFSQTEPPLDAAPTERLFDVLIDHVLVPMKSSAQIASDFADRHQALEDGAHPPDGMDGYKFKMEHVTANDIRYANINVGTAILYLQRFLAEPDKYLTPDALANIDNDALAQTLFKYALSSDRSRIDNGSIRSFLADIIDQDSDTTWAISALIAKQAVVDFTSIYKDGLQMRRSIIRRPMLERTLSRAEHIFGIKCKIRQMAR